LNRPNIGGLHVGKKADLALFKLDEPRFSGAHDPLAALVLCGAYKADAVMIGGQWKVTQGEWLGGDIQKLMATHTACAIDLFKQY
jgi:8-oxoguanine deaminase